MPSIFTLEGHQLGYSSYGPRGHRGRPRGLQGLSNAIRGGLGELSPIQKDFLLVAGALGVVTIVALGGMKAAGRKLKRSLSGTRYRSRRRRRR